MGGWLIQGQQLIQITGGQNHPVIVAVVRVTWRYGGLSPGWTGTGATLEWTRQKEIGLGFCDLGFYIVAQMIRLSQKLSPDFWKTVLDSWTGDSVLG